MNLLFIFIGAFIGSVIGNRIKDSIAAKRTKVQPKTKLSKEDEELITVILPAILHK